MQSVFIQYSHPGHFFVTIRLSFTLFPFWLLRNPCCVLDIQATSCKSSFIFSDLPYPGPLRVPSPLPKPNCCICPWVWQITNSLLAFGFGATFLYKDFSPVLFQPVPVSPSLWKHFLSRNMIFHSVVMCLLSCF